VEGEELMLMTHQGQVIRMPVSGISVIGRNTQGVRLVTLEGGDQVTDVARVISEDPETAGGEADASGNGNGAPGDAAE
jgi:DNA gyrase subunit A